VTPADVERLDCPVTQFIVGIVCEPAAEKVAPLTQSHCRVSLQYTLAEALVRNRLGRDAYEDVLRRDPEILALARRVHYHVDPAYPGPGRFKGAVRATLRDGRIVEVAEEYNRGSAENPMSEDDLRAKFHENAAAVLDAAARSKLADTIARLDTLTDAAILPPLACATVRA
jgi:2-methylcitrate dehydratase PrpD